MSCSKYFPVTNCVMSLRDWGGPPMEELQNELNHVVESVQPQRLVVDFEQTNRCTAGLISTLIVARQKLATHGGQLTLVNMSDQVRQVFQICKLDGTIFDIRENESATFVC